MRVGLTRLVVALVLGVFAWSSSAWTQQPRKIPLIAILSDESPSLGAKSLEPVAQGLRDLDGLKGRTSRSSGVMLQEVTTNLRVSRRSWFVFSRT
jgi:hypothetical protein